MEYYRSLRRTGGQKEKSCSRRRFLIIELFWVAPSRNLDRKLKYFVTSDSKAIQSLSRIRCFYLFCNCYWLLSLFDFLFHFVTRFSLFSLFFFIWFSLIPSPRLAIYYCAALCSYVTTSPKSNIEGRSIIFLFIFLQCS